MSLNLSKINIINILFYFIPISFIAGNLIINLNILLFLIFSLLFYGKEILKIKLFILDKLIVLFFAYLLVLAFYYNIYIDYFSLSSVDFTVLIKTIFYFRFLILYFVLRYLIENKLLNFKFFFVTCGLITLFLCFDLIYQYIFGFDIFGFKGVSRRMAGPFNDELIAGSYLQRFSIFSFFVIPIFFKKFQTRYYNIILAIFFGILFFTVAIAGNRIPFLFFTIMMLLIIIFEKNLKIYLVGFFIITASIFSISYNLSEEFDDHYGVFFYREIPNMIKSFSSNPNYDHLKKFENKEKRERVKKKYVATIGDKKIPLVNVHQKDLYTGYQTWVENKYFGGGVKSYKKNCFKAQQVKKIINCGPHPHNYYLEILANIGLFGLLILLSIFLISFYKTFVKKYFMNSVLNSNQIITPFIFLFFIEIFPVKTTGSFFSTANATYIFLILSILIALSLENKKI